jgi:hypothetical protein
VNHYSLNRRIIESLNRFMKVRFLAAAALLIVARVLALDGQPGIHDPSTVVIQDGKFYTYGTGNGLPISISDDGWTWRRAGTLMQVVAGGREDVIARGGNNTWAPDVIRVGGKYFVYWVTVTLNESGRLGKRLDSLFQDGDWTVEPIYRRWRPHRRRAPTRERGRSTPATTFFRAPTDP